MKKHIALAVILAAGSLAGCASTSELSAAQSAAEKAQSTADQALATANAAKAAAEVPKQRSAANRIFIFTGLPDFIGVIKACRLPSVALTRND